MDVSEAVATRRSTRAYLDTPVSDETIRELLVKASRAPSGGNVQPWRIFVINGDTMKRFRRFIATRTEPEPLDYDIYPKELWEPYRSSRYKLGEDMYALLGIPREDKPRRLAWFAENLKFFGAPAGLFCFVDRRMGSPQWSDLGMFLQTFMLLATEAGINTCAQESWSLRPKSVAEFVGADDELMLFCGMAIGYRDPSHPVNQLVSDRELLSVWATFV
jgi:nitroreductase